MTHVAEFPKMLRHPEHRDAVPATQEAVVQNGGVKWIPVPAVPAYLPDVLVDTPEAERAWRDKGYGPAGHWDEEAALADSAEAVLEASGSSASMAQHQPYVRPGAPLGILDVAALKRGIVGELAPMLEGMIREALAPAVSAPPTKRGEAGSGTLKSPLTRKMPVTSEASSEGEYRISAPPEEISRPKKKPSGAAYRKLRRQRAEEEMMRLKSSPKLAALS
jgi:hypothetical protein